MAMKTMQFTEEEKKRGERIARWSIGIWLLLFISSQRLPYMHSEFHFNIQKYVIFPLIFVGLIWISYVHVWAVSGKTGFQMAMDKNGAFAGKNPLVMVSLAVAGALLCSGTFAYSCSLFPAWCSQLFAGTPMQGLYHVAAVGSNGGNTQVRLIAHSDRSIFTLPLAGVTVVPPGLQRGETVCIRGRTTFTGGVVMSISRRVESC